MKSLLKEHIKQQIISLIEEREYSFRKLSPACYSALVNDLNISSDYVTDVKIVKATRPIFKIFFDNGKSFNLIDNGGFVQADISRILFDLQDSRDLEAAKYEVDELMNQGNITDPNETPGDEDNFEDELGGGEETPDVEPEEEPEV
jgi:hypothetical protein